MFLGPEPFPLKCHTRVDTEAIPSVPRVRVSFRVRNTFGIGHGTINREPMGRADVSDDRGTRLTVTRDATYT